MISSVKKASNGISLSRWRELIDSVGCDVMIAFARPPPPFIIGILLSSTELLGTVYEVYECISLVVSECTHSPCSMRHALLYRRTRSSSSRGNSPITDTGRILVGYDMATFTEFVLVAMQQLLTGMFRVIPFLPVTWTHVQHFSRRHAARRWHPSFSRAVVCGEMC